MKRFLGLAVVLALMQSATTMAEAPSVMNFQGRLSDAAGNALPDGPYNITFAISDDSTAGTLVWSESQLVNTVDGTFSVLLGSVNPLGTSVFSGASRFIGIQIEGEPEITPRSRMASVPYAFQAGATASSASPTPDTTWIAPYFRAVDASGSLAITIISIYNADTTSNLVTLAFYNAQGTLIDQCTNTIAPGQLWLFKSNASSCPNVTNHEGYVIVSGHGPIAPAGIYMAQALGSPTGQVSSANLAFFRL